VGIFALTDGYILIGATVLSDHGNRITVVDNRDAVEITAFGAVNKAITKGLGDGSIEFQLFQDFAAGKTHATLQPLIGSTTPTTVEVRATSGARAVTNPAAVMQGLLMEYRMLDGGIGDVTVVTCTFQNAAQAGITYPTA